MYRKTQREKEFIHYDPIKGMNSRIAQDLAYKLNKIEKRIFTRKIREIECSRQINNYDCGVYVILYIIKIIGKLANGEENLDK